jgi:PTS system ascorbate-specific IIA component
MSIGLLIITHNAIGQALLQTAHNMLEGTPLPAETLDVFSDSDPDELRARAAEIAKRLDQGDGVLVMTDMYGSTPSNIAYNLLEMGRVHVVAGINLPMLVRVLNYPELDLQSLTQKAMSGGSEGIVCCLQRQAG